MTKTLLLLAAIGAGAVLSGCADYPAYYGPPPGQCALVPEPSPWL